MSGIGGTLEINGAQFTYGERKRNNNRGIAIARNGVANSKGEYMFKPNPHTADSKWYNKHQEDFYKLAARKLVNLFLTNGNVWPVANGSTTIEVNDVDYRLD